MLRIYRIHIANTSRTDQSSFLSFTSLSTLMISNVGNHHRLLRAIQVQYEPFSIVAGA